MFDFIFDFVVYVHQLFNQLLCEAIWNIFLLFERVIEPRHFGLIVRKSGYDEEISWILRKYWYVVM